MNHTHGMAHSLAEPIFWVAAVICVVAELAILRSAFMPRPGAIESAEMPHSSRGIEMIWAIVPAVALAVLMAATWRAVNH
ncbi:MAG TPA: hypothetical protein VGC52_06070 [Gemmatimonadaceae bacterium]